MNLLSDSNFPGGTQSIYQVSPQAVEAGYSKKSQGSELNLLQAEPITNPFEGEGLQGSQSYPNDLLDLTDFEAISPGKSENKVKIQDSPEANLLDPEVSDFSTQSGLKNDTGKDKAGKSDDEDLQIYFNEEYAAPTKVQMDLTGGKTVPKKTLSSNPFFEELKESKTKTENLLLAASQKTQFDLL